MPDIKDFAQITIQIDPCQIESFVSEVTPHSQSYEVASSQITSFSYQFTQTNACGYEESVIVQSLPDFVVHNNSQRDFSVFTDDLENVGQFTVTIQSTIVVPTDYTRSTQNPVVSTADFVLSVVATCDATMFVDWTLPGTNIQSYVKGVPVTQAIGPVEDAVSRIKGNADGLTYCGSRAYRIIDEETVSSFISIDSDLETLVIEPSQDA